MRWDHVSTFLMLSSSSISHTFQSIIKFTAFFPIHCCDVVPRHSLVVWTRRFWILPLLVLDTGTSRAVPGSPVVPGLKERNIPVLRARSHTAFTRTLHANRLIKYPEILVPVSLNVEVGL